MTEIGKMNAIAQCGNVEGTTKPGQGKQGLEGRSGPLSISKVFLGPMVCPDVSATFF